LLFIPIGQENNVVRRHPWVSWALIGLNFLVFTAMAFVGDDARDEAFERLQAVVEYLAEHPYLSPPPEIAKRLGDEFLGELDKARQQWQRVGELPEPDGVAAEQARLNGLSQEAVEALRSLPSYRLGYVPAEPRLPSLLTSMFVHAGFLHIFGNMLFLFLSGPFIEDLYGRPLFAGLYLLSGLAGLAAHVAKLPDSVIPVVGASGAIAGVMGAFLVRLWNARINFLVLPIPILWMLRFRMLLPAFVVLPLWFGEQLWYGHTEPDAGVAYWVHIGGFLFGTATAVIVKLARVEETWVNPAVEKQTTLTQDPAIEGASDARLAGDLPRARREIRGALARQPDNVDAWAESYEIGLAAQDAPEVGRSLVRLIELYQRLGEQELAGQIAYDGRWAELAGIPARARLAVAAYFEKLGDGRQALEEYQRIAVECPSDPAALRALMRRATLLQRGGDLKGAREALRHARAHPGCTDSWPATIDRALAELERPGAQPVKAGS
jgi:membrane associated rhomboid family serine protease